MVTTIGEFEKGKLLLGAGTSIFQVAVPGYMEIVGVLVSYKCLCGLCNEGPLRRVPEMVSSIFHLLLTIL